jgi:hypothetical protein
MAPRADRSSLAVRVRACAVVVSTALALLAVSPNGAGAATGKSTTGSSPLFPVPASARVHGGTTKTSTQAKTTPSPAASGAQPGTVAPGAPTPTTATPTTAVPTTSGTPTPTTPTTPAPATTAPSGATGPSGTTGSATVVGVARKATPNKRLSTGALALAILGGLLALGCAVWVLSRWMALEPRWTVAVMHSLREASYRASATWAEFADWVRLGH